MCSITVRLLRSCRTGEPVETRDGGKWTKSSSLLTSAIRESDRGTHSESSSGGGGIPLIAKMVVKKVKIVELVSEEPMLGSTQRPHCDLGCQESGPISPYHRKAWPRERRGEEVLHHLALQFPSTNILQVLGVACRHFLASVSDNNSARAD